MKAVEAYQEVFFLEHALGLAGRLSLHSDWLSRHSRAQSSSRVFGVVVFPLRLHSGCFSASSSMLAANVSSTHGEKTRRPPVKVLSSQLREAKGCSVESGKTELSIRRLGSGSRAPLAVSVVWMQGTVVETHTDQNSLLLLDETGNFHITGVNNIPRGKPCLSPGKYVMVMGVIQSHSPEPVLRAVKMADLSDNAAVHRKMWKYEVEDLQQTLP